jgi:general nucleoside transport system permease protein
VTERLAVVALAALTLLSLWVAPWAALNRETGARSAVMLLPNRIVDFTGRTAPVEAPGQRTVLLLSAAGLLVVIGASALGARPRRLLWLAAGAMLVATTVWGLGQFGAAVDQQRLASVRDEVREAVARPRPAFDVDVLQALVDDPGALALEELVARAREGGLIIRRLPFTGAALGPAAFLTMLAGLLAVFSGARVVQPLNRPMDRALASVAIPAVSIALALVAAAVVILFLQPTPRAAGIVIDAPLVALAGRIDTVWFAYYTMFADSLATAKGFADALSFATPLIFTGLAVGFGFRAGLFNIGAPGQMVLGAIFTMFVGLYVPGPAVLVLPLAVAAAALGGGLWGALPGWLKARFGANEVINTILLNFVASALLLFMLSSSPTFAAAAVRVIQLIGVVLGVMVVALLIPWTRRVLGRGPRLALAVVGLVLLVGAVVVSQPQPGDRPYVLELPFKVPGSEPKSHELQPSVRLPRLPAVFGIDLRQTPGTNVVPVDLALPAALVVGVVALVVANRWRRPERSSIRLVAAAAAALVAYGLLAALGWRAVPLAIPPSNLNPSFLIAIGAAVFVHYFLFRTRFGFDLRATGLSPKAAEYGGANLRRGTVTAMAISGALAGLTATHYVLGGALEDYALRQSIPTSDGFDGIAVALLGGNSPVGIVLAAFLFGVLKNGGSLLNITFSNLTRDVVSMILALVVLFIAAKGFLGERYTNPLRRAKALGDLPPELVPGTPPASGNPYVAPDEPGAGPDERGAGPDERSARDDAPSPEPGARPTAEGRSEHSPAGPRRPAPEEERG